MLSPAHPGPPSFLPVVVIVASALVISGCSTPPAGPGTDPASPGDGAFNEITAAAGIEFSYRTGATGGQFMPEVMGAGGGLFDHDGDGDLDIYLTNGNSLLPQAGSAPGSPNRLYSQQPDGSFVDATESAGLGDEGYGMGLAVGDIDNDGDVDLYLTNFGPDRLYLNRGDGRFDEHTAAAGLGDEGWSASATFCDLDNDGYLDLYVTRYVRFIAERRCTDDSGRSAYCGPQAFPPVHDLLYMNNGDGTFRDGTASSGIAAAQAAGLGVICEDFNNDGHPDIYVANDAYANQLWIGDGQGNFRDEALFRGVAFNMHGQAEAGMGVLAADFDGDTHVDLFITHLKSETNTLYRNLGTGTGFRDATGESGLGESSMAYTGFGTAALDLELDGDLDLIVANGRVKRGSPLAGAGVEAPWNVFAEPNLFYLNEGEGRFRLAPERAGPPCEPIEITRGLATGDLDGDGDLDMLVTNIESPTRLYRNDADRAGNHWLGVRARDPRLRRVAIGARIEVDVQGRRSVRTIHRGFSYLSSSEPVAHFGLGGAEKIDGIEVRWPDGSRERFPAAPVDRYIVLERGSGEVIGE